MRSADDELAEIDNLGLRRRLRILESPQSPVVTIDGREMINFSSNDYLGIANSSILKNAFVEGIERFGAGSGASRLISGTHAPHRDFERALANFKQTEAALFFGSGYATATGAIPAIVGKNDIVILDKLCHASLIDGAKLSGATMRVFPHNDLTKLESHLRWAREQIGDAEGRTLILTESVFSMDGDVAPLSEIIQLKNEYNSLLLVDEAHAFGVLGPNGRGYAAMGTLSKAAGLSGGYLCSSKPWIDLIINRARSFIYSTAPPPALAAAASASLSLISGPEGDALREKLHINIRRFSETAQSAIIPRIIGENEATLAIADQLQNSGFLVPAIRFPTVPRGTARLRITLSAAHSEGQIDLLKNELTGLIH
ncbi:UNVERIFIED_CONTAM: hypothetical protein GTU68_017137 [Idotea baltica]|nr:hypothetical protein [Idotea baltica]